jgi:diaminopimelate epimerase
MQLQFAKYHGTGNDFVILREADLPREADPASLARTLCARTTGVGADGLLLVREGGAPRAFEMVIYNSDGSLAPMCGNGIRCFAAYLLDEGLETADIYSVRTGAGELTVAVMSRSPFVCEIDMGKPIYEPAASGIDTDEADFLNKQLEMPDGSSVTASTFFMGTVHTVVWMDEEDEAVLEGFGQALHKLPIFTGKTNVNMAHVLGEDGIRLRTYERGAGMTAACGTGACAAAVLAYREGKTRNVVRVLLPLGELRIRIEDGERVYMSGPAVRIERGIFYD